MKNKRRFGIAVGLVSVLVCLALGLIAVNSLSRPVVSCAPSPDKTISTPPQTLVTAQDYLAQGDYDYAQGNCDRAIASYSHAIALSPRFAEAYNNRAFIQMVKKDYAAALPDLDQALLIRPNYINALMNRADIFNYYYAIDYQRAVADYDRVLGSDPGAAGYTSVCGHRLLALNHGWSLNVAIQLLTRGVSAGCP